LGYTLERRPLIAKHITRRRLSKSTLGTSSESNPARLPYLAGSLYLKLYERTSYRLRASAEPPAFKVENPWRFKKVRA
jgi:hypothetical protein